LACGNRIEPPAALQFDYLDPIATHAV
jgi:hypothetical protein